MTIYMTHINAIRSSSLFMPSVSSRSLPFRRLKPFPAFFKEQKYSVLLSASSRQCPISGQRVGQFTIMKANLWDLTLYRASEINSRDLMDEDVLENKVEPEEIVLREKHEADGTINKVIFRIGQNLTVEDVQNMYDKMCRKATTLVGQSYSRIIRASFTRRFPGQVGWIRNAPETVAISLRNSYMIATLHLIRHGPDADISYHEKLIGMARAASDHAFNAVIWDVVVDPLYQGYGLGKALLEQMIGALNRKDITVVTLFSVGTAVDFYKKLGFEIEPEGIKGMHWER